MIRSFLGFSAYFSFLLPTSGLNSRDPWRILPGVVVFFDESEEDKNDPSGTMDLNLCVKIVSVLAYLSN